MAELNQIAFRVVCMTYRGHVLERVRRYVSSLSSRREIVVVYSLDPLPDAMLGCMGDLVLSLCRLGGGSDVKVVRGVRFDGRIEVCGGHQVRSYGLRFVREVLEMERSFKDGTSV